MFEEADRLTDLQGWSLALAGGLQRSTGTRACQLLRVHDGGRRLESLAASDEVARHVLSAGHGSLDDEQMRRIYRSGAAVMTVGDVHGGSPPARLATAMAEADVADILGLVAPPGVSVGLFLSASRPLDVRARHVWLSIARLVGAGVAIRAEGAGEGSLDGDLPARLRGALAELDLRRARARRSGDARDAEGAFAFLGALANEGFAVVQERRLGSRRQLVAVRPRDAGARALRSLDAGERRVLEAIRRGKSLKEVAFELGIAEATVSGRIARIRSKIGIDPRTDLVHLASLHDDR